MRRYLTRALPCLLLALCCAACGSDDPATPANPAIEGAWGLQSQEEGDVRVYTRLDSLTGDQDGYQFDADGTLLVRDAGWCGTPPLVYFNYEGSWAAEAEDSLVLTYPHWSGVTDFRFEIISLEQNELRCTVAMME